MKLNQVVVTTFYVVYLLIICVEATAPENSSQYGITPNQYSSSFNLTIDPPQIKRLVAGDSKQIVVMINGTLPAGAKLRLISGDVRVAEVHNATENLESDCLIGCLYYANVLGVRIGRTVVRVEIFHKTDQSDKTPNVLAEVDYRVSVWRRRGIEVSIYLIITAVLLALITFGFGCQLELDTLLQIIKRPVPPFIGFLCQFIALPVLGFALSQALGLPAEFGFGLLTYSCSPGGGVSNVFASILEGDLTLSLIMTFLSTLLSLGMMPMWMLILSRYFVDPAVVVIPYLEIVKALLLLTIPCILGIIVKAISARVGRIIIYITRLLSIFFLLFQTAACASVNSYMFRVIYDNPIILPAVLLLPVCGFTAGYVISKICQQPHYRALTIALETSIQNVGIPIIMLLYAFRQPDGDLGAVLPMAASYTTVVPMLIVYIVFRIYKCCRGDQPNDAKPVPMEEIQNDLKGDDSMKDSDKNPDQDTEDNYDNENRLNGYVV